MTVTRITRRRFIDIIDKKGIYALLDKYQIIYEAHEHPAVYTMEELDTLNLPHRENIVKNLFLCDHKKENYYLVTVLGYRKIDLNMLRNKLACRKLTFASEDALRDLLMLERGHVTPLGILNNRQINVTAIFDKSLQDRRIGIHPLENTSTIFIAFEDIKKLIQDHGNAVIMCEFD